MKGLQRFVKNSGKWVPPRDPNLVSSLFWVSHCIIHQLQTWLPSNWNLIPPSKEEARRLHLGGGTAEGGLQPSLRGKPI